MPRYAILAEGRFDYLLSKTGNAVLRYRPEEAAVVIDSESAGKTVQEVIGFGGEVPIVASFEDSLTYKPDTLLIGIAPPGGIVPYDWRATLFSAIENGLNIVSGLHEFLSDDEELKHAAARKSVTIKDLRKPVIPLPFYRGSWKTRKTPVLLTVGNDCDTGKMTVAWELKNALEKTGKRGVMVGTGQTGILLSGRGVAVDAVVSDFVSGAVEAEIDSVEGKTDIIIVEGQGSLNHQAYSGVTLGLLHGAMPDMMVMCHEPNRIKDTFDYPIPDLNELMEWHVSLLKPFKEVEYAGISLLTHGLSEVKSKKEIKNYSKKYGLPVSDIVRFGAEPILESILQKLE